MPDATNVRLQVLSDLHLGNTPFEHPHTDADIVILAGDISRPAQALQWATQFRQPVLYVAGNHENYGSSIEETMRELRRMSADTRVHMLERDALVTQGIRFLGTTLWSTFDLIEDEAERTRAIDTARGFIRDFSRIRSDTAPGPFSASDMNTLFDRNRAWLKQQLATPFDGPTVVITHHAPSQRSIHPRFEGSAVNACFVSNCEDLMGKGRVALWIHGHTHNSFDYQVNGTRVLCNPRGYVQDGTLENPAFNPQLVVQPG